jgi:hypothetical protein
MPRPYVLKNPPAPEVRRERARKAGRASAAARMSVDHYIAKLVEAAPPLTDEQRAKLSVLLAPAGGAE